VKALSLGRWKLPPLSLKLPARIGFRDHVIGGALGLVYVMSLVLTARTIGFMRDEGVYFRAATNYVGWWRSVFERGSDALKQSAIDGPWSDNHEHPALMKTLFGISWWLFHETWHVFADATTAYRFPAMCTAGLAIWTTYLFGARAYGRFAGLVAAILLALMPHVFFHAHLACFDVPIMAMWVLCIYVHWRAQERGGILWAIASGVVFGLTLETKHNAWVLPAVLVPHALFVHRHAFWRELKAGRVTLPSSLVSMAILGPIVFIALWPYLWNDTFARIEWWFEFHLNHEYYNIEFLGKNYFGPPSPKSYVPVMILATIPTVTVLLFVTGAVGRAVLGGHRLGRWILATAAPEAAGDEKGNAAEGEKVETAAREKVETAAHEKAVNPETDLLLFLGFVVAIGPFFLPKTPIFGGTKHWLTAYPFLALFAGYGFEMVRRAMHRALPSSERMPPAYQDAALALCVVIAPLAVTAHSNPYGIAAYVPLVGGTQGGADWGFNRQFWGYTSENAAGEYLNESASRNASVYVHDTTWDAWTHMQEEGRVRKDLRAVFAPHESQYALVEHELHMNELDYAIWVAFGTDAPVYIVEHDGVPMVSIYKRMP
jgi:4-amino-4-deoxy-L-arabinose transferase-like glycosyltransferase